MMKMKKRNVVLVIACLVTWCFSACGTEKEEPSDFNTEAEMTEGDEDLETGTEGAAIASEVADHTTNETEDPLNHYYNRGLYIKDGYTYRQLADGLYRRQAGSEDWELLCEIPMNYGRGLACFGDRLYFAGYQEKTDTQGNEWNNTVYYYDTDTGEYGELLSSDILVGTLDVYDGCLYIQTYVSEGGYLQYEGYRLDENGGIEEELDPEAENFLCRDQNEYRKEEYEYIQEFNTGRLTDTSMVYEWKREVIPIPSCARLLDGKALLRQQKNEGESHFILRDTATEEETVLFDGSDVLAVMKEGIYYSSDLGEKLWYYDFAAGTSQEIALPEFWEGDNYLSGAVYMTYDENAIYYYDYSGLETDTPQIIRIDLDDWSYDAIAEGEILNETEGFRVNQVDGEYFYHGEQMYLLEEE